MKDKDIDKKLEKLRIGFEPLNENITPPLSLFPIQAEKAAEKTSQKRNNFYRFIKSVKGKAAIAACLTVVIIFASVFAINLAPGNNVKIESTTPVQNPKQLITALNQIYDNSHYGTSLWDNIFGGFAKKDYLTEDSESYYSGNKSSVGEKSAGATDQAANRVEKDSGYSTTNTQEKGVDEDDIIKVDNQYIYYAFFDGETNKVRITITDTESMKIVGEIKYDSQYTDGNVYKGSGTAYYDSSYQPAGYNNIKGMYLTDSKLTVIKSSIKNKTDSEFANVTDINIYDVTDKSKPTLVQNYQVDGYYVSSRMVGNTLYTVTNMQVDVSKKVNKNNVEEFIPTCTKDGKSVSIDYKDITIIDSEDSTSYIVLSAVDVTSNKDDINCKTVLGGGDNVYATESAIYVSGYSYSENYDSITNFVKFKLDGCNIAYAGAFKANGSIIGQYAMSEYNGYFRVATTDNTANNVFVFNKDLKLCGSLKGIAKDESIKSARFENDKCYLVTYYETDPLFAIDLSNPSKPTILGKLKIPGFSTYLHKYNENLLIGVGYDDSSNLKLSLFDVKSSEDMAEIDTHIISDDIKDFYSANSEVQNNPKAFVLDSKRGNILLPITGYDVTSSYSNIGFAVYKASEKGLEYVTSYSEESTSTYYYNVVRSAYIGDIYYMISNDGIVAYNIEQLKVVGKTAF